MSLIIKLNKYAKIYEANINNGYPYLLWQDISLTPIITGGSGSGITGAGTEADPYLIWDAAGLASINSAINCTSDIYFRLMADLDLSSYSDWTPIDGTGSVFNSNFDGNGHTISNLKRTSNVDPGIYVGLFGNCSGQTVIKNLIVDGVNFSCTISGGGTSGLGVVAGKNSGYVQDIRVKNVVMNISGTTQAYIGGVVALSDGATEINMRCSAENVTINYSGSAQVYLGGMVGGGGNWEQCFSKNVTITHNRNACYAGGFAGAGVSLTNCYALYVSINDNATTDSAFAQGGAMVGAVNTLTITNCYVVGLASYSENADLNNAWAGNLGVDCDTSYSDTTYSEEDTLKINGSGAEPNARTTSQMRTQSNYIDWDFDDVWTI